MSTNSSLGFKRFALPAITLAPLAMLQPACTTARDASSVADHNTCNFINYKHDEATNSAGPGKCASDCDCDGMRSCTAGACQGTARPQLDCNSPDRHWNEAWNPQGAGKCASDCECDGQRTCTAGACTGVARKSSPPPAPAVTADAQRPYEPRERTHGGRSP